MAYVLKSPIVERMILHNPRQEGNHLVVLDIWRQRLTKSTKRRSDIPYDEAINLYAETVSWYTPYYPDVKDGRASIPQQRFAGEYFKNSYAAIEERFGYTQRIATEAFKYLEKHYLLERITINRRYGKDMYIKLNFPNYLILSKPDLTKGWMQSALSKPAENSFFERPSEIRGYDKYLLELLAESLILMVCGSGFRKLKTWLSELNERQLENALLLCVNILKFPDEYRTIREFPGLIKSMSESGERVNVPMLCKSWIYEAIEKMQVGQTPDFSSLD